MSFEQPTPQIDNAAYSLEMYTRFVAFELRETAGAVRFQVFHPAPENIPLSDLEDLAAACREAGFSAEVAPLEHEDQGYFGVKISG